MSSKKEVEKSTSVRSIEKQLKRLVTLSPMVETTAKLQRLYRRKLHNTKKALLSSLRECLHERDQSVVALFQKKGTKGAWEGYSVEDFVFQGLWLLLGEKYHTHTISFSSESGSPLDAKELFSVFSEVQRLTHFLGKAVSISVSLQTVEHILVLKKK